MPFSSESTSVWCLIVSIRLSCGSWWSSDIKTKYKSYRHLPHKACNRTTEKPPLAKDERWKKMQQPLVHIRFRTCWGVATKAPAACGRKFLLFPRKFLSGSQSPLAIIILSGGYTSCSVHFLQVILLFEHSIKPRLIVSSVRNILLKLAFPIYLRPINSTCQ